MEAMFTLPYAEFCVAQQLTRLFPSKRGYSVFVPTSRQEPGVDLLLARRAGGQTRAATIQVKTSRTYNPRPAIKARSERYVTKRSFRYYTWFSTFPCPPNADFFALIALYPARDTQERRELGGWWAPQILLFTQLEMRRFLRSVRTVAGKPDRMFGFGFDEPRHVYQTRGDRHRRGQEYSSHVLERRVGMLRTFLLATARPSNRTA
jgi:hypothetical protein